MMESSLKICVICTIRLTLGVGLLFQSNMFVLTDVCLGVSP